MATASLGPQVHTATPTLSVLDPRGLAVRAVQFHRRQANEPLESRVTHQRYDSAGRPVASRDPRLFAMAQADESVPANLSQTFSLSSLPLATHSVDSGWQTMLQGAAGQTLERWDSRGSHSLTECDALLRPVAVHERGEDVAEHTLERFSYAGADADSAAHNLCGQLIRHDDPAGTLHLHDLGLGGAVLKQTRHFLRDSAPPDWPSEVPARNTLLEPGDGATTWNTCAPTNEPLSQTDALGNLQAFAHTVAGELKNTRLKLAGSGQVEQVLVSNIHYNALGQVESENAGNGVITRHRYDPADGRLTRLSAHKTDGSPLQDLAYRYDPVGNVLSIEESEQSIRYFKNQRVAPITTYHYNTLYQLIKATGREASTGLGGPALPGLQPLPAAPNQIANYTQTYHYDPAGNLLELEHLGAQRHGRTLTRARNSNRCLPNQDDRPPTEDELAAGFDANGNLHALQPGQHLSWDLRNQLQQVRPVIRDNAEDDHERYVYDGGGQRVRKVRTSQTHARTLISEVRYLPGLEIRTHGGTGEILQVISATAGRNSVRVLHWVAGQPDDIPNDQLRYSLNDHLGSSTLELDQQANLISQESYYPFGGTAWWAGRNATEAKYKTVRYSGKERDATGLYYYGFRYYAPWLQRWINPDPAGYVDGMNLYRMTRNNPVCFLDDDGQLSKESRKLRRLIERDLPITGRGMTAITKNNPDLAKKIKTGMDNTKNYLTSAIEAIEEMSRDESNNTYKAIISDYMGEGLETEMILAVINMLYATSKQYGHNSQRIAAVKDTSPSAITVYNTTNIKNLYINDSILNQPDEFVGVALIHEYAHISELDARDFYSLSKESLPGDGAQLIASNWLNNKYRIGEIKKDDREDFIQASNEKDMPSALKRYETDRGFREFVSMTNADSWAHMIYSLSNSRAAQNKHASV
ncbi:RHS repeat-associated core domain-containing protein [Pseudomonas purpurea]|uniref:RHS repeat domain-containing protein n=1 Tax=Pseudomonas purpurea TaxID=3136737 RepID=UPI0032651782